VVDKLITLTSGGDTLLPDQSYQFDATLASTANEVPARIYVEVTGMVHSVTATSMVGYWLDVINYGTTDDFPAVTA